MAGVLFLAVIATCLDLWAYSLLPMSVIATFAGLNIVLTLSLASTGLLCSAEKLGFVEILAAFIILVGVYDKQGFKSLRTP